MCGIVGIVAGPDAAPPTEAVGRAMNAAILHRGPDDEGVFCDGRALLGMRRLSIIDVAGGHQPIHNEDSTVQAVFNGEIYNFRELRAELQARGHRFYTSSDTEVIVHGYEEWGDALLPRLDGMFAFALWDTRKKSLLVARDRFGEKPLFYDTRDGRLAFAERAQVAACRARLRRRDRRRRGARLRLLRLRADAGLDLPRHPQAAARPLSALRRRQDDAAPALLHAVARAQATR